MMQIHSTHLFASRAAGSPNPNRVNFLMTDLQLAVGYLEKRKLRNSARSRAIQRNARGTYDEAVRLLAVQSFSDTVRRSLEAQAAILKDRLVHLGERF